MKPKSAKRKTGPRETDRLIRNIAICTRCPDETLKEAEAEVRSKLQISSQQNGKPIIVILREMWQELTTGSAHKRLNEMIAKGYMRPLTFNEFDRHKEVLRNMQKRAKHWDKTREEAKVTGLLH